MFKGLTKISEVSYIEFSGPGAKEFARLSRERRLKEQSRVPTSTGMGRMFGAGILGGVSGVGIGGLIGKSVRKYHQFDTDTIRKLLASGRYDLHGYSNAALEKGIKEGIKFQVPGSHMGRGALIGGGVGISAGLLAALMARRKKMNRENQSV